jgi:WD40 repeat protein
MIDVMFPCVFLCSSLVASEPFFVKPSEYAAIGVTNPVESIRFLSESRFVLLSKNGAITLCNIKKTTAYTSNENNEIRMICSSRDGGRLLVSGKDHVLLVDVERNQVMARFKHIGPSGPSLVAISASGTHMAFFSGYKLEKGQYKSWFIECYHKDKLLWKKESDRQAYSLAISPDGTHVATDYADGQIVEIENGKSAKEIFAHFGEVFCLEFASNEVLVSGGGDETCNVIDVERKSILHSLGGFRGSVIRLKMVQNNLVASMASKGLIRFMDIANGKVKTTLGKEDWTIVDFDISDDLEHVFVRMPAPTLTERRTGLMIIDFKNK